MIDEIDRRLMSDKANESCVFDKYSGVIKNL